MCTNCISDQSLPAIPQSDSAFADKLVAILNGAGAALMISVGHQTGLFDVLAELPPSTADQIAKAAKLNERYVREWLGAMTTAEVVRYDRDRKTYELPAAHAEFMTRKNAANNIATLTQYIGVLAGVEDKIVDCFRNGGGVPYSEFPRFHEVMAEDSGQSTLSSLLDSIVPIIPNARERLENGIAVLDIGCGRGKALLLLAKTFPKSNFTGYDISDEALDWAGKEAVKDGLKNIRFVKQDASEIRDEGKFELILTFDAIHDQAKPMTVLKNIRRALTDDGIYMMQDIDARSEVGDNLSHPIGTVLYTISCMHCMTVSLAQNGEGLGAMWGNEMAASMLRDAELNLESIERLPHDIQNCYYICRKN